MSINEIREYVIGQYADSPTWAARVKKMSDNQVIAIYYKMRRKRLCRHPKSRQEKRIWSYRLSGPLWLPVRSSLRWRSLLAAAVVGLTAALDLSRLPHPTPPPIHKEESAPQSKKV